MKENSINWQLGVFILGGFFISCALVLPLILILGIAAWGVYFIIKIQHGRTITRASGVDTMLGVQTKESLPYFHGIGRLDGHFPVESIKELMMRKGINYTDDDGNKPFRRYSQIYEKHLGYHIFRDDPNFDINNHIHYVTLDDLFGQPFDLAAQVEKEKEVNSSIADDWQVVVQRLMKEYGTRKLPANKPQWEIIFLHEHSQRTTLLFRINHCITDGIYFLRFLIESLADRPVEYKLPYNYHQPSMIKRFFIGLLGFCLIPYAVVKILSRMCRKVYRNPLHGPKLTGKKNFLLSRQFPVDDLKAMKSVSKVSVNAMLFSCISYALKKQFRKRKASVPFVGSAVPISLQDLSKPICTKNSFGLQEICIPTKELGVENDSALARLQQVNKMLNQSMGDFTFAPVHWIMRYVCPLLPSDMGKILLSSKGLTTSLSNVAGPQKEYLHMCGAKQIDLAFWVPDRTPTGMGISVISLKGNVRVGITADTAILETPEEGYTFLEDFLEELGNMKRELNIQNVEHSSIEPYRDNDI